ncbi:MAG: cytochrome-c peroxidase [Bacteroidia bacterium]|jgi:cytochrome c peroxidase|nr:cytochrome-c peroxidase [Bacteroidia bacterium]
MNKVLGSFVILFLLLHGCTKDDAIIANLPPQPDTGSTFKPTPYLLEIPFGLPPLPLQPNNPLTVEGVELGRKLFFDKILSRDLTQSCGSCHNQLFGFTDNGKRFSMGITGAVGVRNSMPLFNLAWVEQFARTNHRFFWDGGATNLESQAIDPIINPIEMDDSLPNVLNKLRNHPQYPAMFKKAFGSDSITTAMLMKALAQFERTIVSGGTRFDYYRRGFNDEALTPQEKRGFDLYVREDKADCFHCHSVGPFMSDFSFRHNGHQSTDVGLGRITNNPEDNGKFRVPSLRNLVFTAPYMHDGRFATLEEVVEFYNSGAIRTAPADPVLTKHPHGLELTEAEKADLVAFLKTMTDSTLLTNQKYFP